MLSGVLRTKERKIIAVLLAMIILISGIIFINSIYKSQKYKEQAVMAEEYLKEGNYEQAVSAYLKAISMKNSNEELMTLGLSDAYIGINEYDKALEVLRACYTKTGGTRIKEKIEEVTIKRTDFEFNQTLSHADKYFTNGEYDKAIAEYEKAKNIKSKEAISYQRIAESYIAMGDYAHAREEITDGLELTQSEELEVILSTVEAYQQKLDYDSYVSEAAEYILQENYEDAIKKYKDAIRLLPKEVAAYAGLADAYISLENYESAIVLLKDALELIYHEDLLDRLQNATKLKEEQDEKNRILSELYQALNLLDTGKIEELMKNQTFTDKIATGDRLVYMPKDLGSSGYGMILYNKSNLYAGAIMDGLKKGFGVNFSLWADSKKQGYYYYEGEWNYDIPSGIGRVVEISSVTEGNEDHWIKTITEGIYRNGREHGTMHKYFYKDEIETGNVFYTAEEGIPVPLKGEDGQPLIEEETGQYAIGIVFLGGSSTGKYYKVAPDTVWGVESYLK